MDPLVQNIFLNKRKEMKKIELIIAFVITLFISDYTTAQITHLKHGDTIMELNIDTDYKSAPLHKNYQKDPKIVETFSKYMVQKIISPVDTNNQIYKNFITRGRQLSQTAKTELVKTINRFPPTLEFTKLKNVEEISKCSLVVLPMYYLTHNIVNYDNKTNLMAYFNLDTATVFYKLMMGNKVMGIIYIAKKRSFVTVFSTKDSLGYYQILRMHHTPIPFMLNIKDQNDVSIPHHFDSFGYISKGHIVLVYGGQGQVIQTNSKNSTTKIVENKYMRFTSAESFYLGSDSSVGNLSHFINNENKRLQAKPR